MKIFSFIIILLTLMFSTPSFSEGEAVCNWEKKFAKNHQKFGSLSVVIKNNTLISLNAEFGYSTGQEGGAGFCNFDVPGTDSDTKIEITYKENTFEITTKVMLYPDKKAQYKLIITKTGYKLEFVDPDFRLCGNNAEWPESIEIINKSKTCMVIE